MKFENTPEDLKRAFEALNVRHGFKPGQLVRWKEGLRNKAIDGPFIVFEKLEDGMLSTKEGSASSYFREPLDIIVGAACDGFFGLFHLDSRRLEPLPD